MTERVSELAWALHHQEDLDADFLRFYRTDWSTLTGPRYFSLAQRVSAYGGVMTAVVQEAMRPPEPEEEDTLPPLPPGALTVPESAMADLIQG